MMQYQSDQERNRAAKQKAEQEAARKFQEEADARRVQNTQDDDCGSFFDTMGNICNVVTYVVCCCGCFTSFEDWEGCCPEQ